MRQTDKEYRRDVYTLLIILIIILMVPAYFNYQEQKRLAAIELAGQEYIVSVMGK